MKLTKRQRYVAGGAMGYTVNLDFFDILTEDAAQQYATQHGLTLTGNGILYVDPDATLTLVPLKTDVVILYYAGGVESLEQRYASPEQLRAWVLGDTAAMPGAMPTCGT